MNVRVIVEPDDAAWRGQLSLEEDGMTDIELKSLAAHGTFEIDAGGSFDGGDLDDQSLADLTFTLTTNLVALPDDFPLIEVFTGTDADRKAAVWTQTVFERLTTALVTWLALSETYETNSVHTIP